MCSFQIFRDSCFVLFIPDICSHRGIGIQDVRYSIVKKCLSEKLTIMKDKDSRSLNKRSELMNKCRHKRRQKLASKKKLWPLMMSWGSGVGWRGKKVDRQRTGSQTYRRGADNTETAVKVSITNHLCTNSVCPFQTVKQHPDKQR